LTKLASKNMLCESRKIAKNCFKFQQLMKLICTFEFRYYLINALLRYTIIKRGKEMTMHLNLQIANYSTSMLQAL